MRRIESVLLTTGVLALTIFMIPNALRAATINVTTTADEANVANGRCSLREAIESANQNTAIGGCVAIGTFGNDVINVPAGTYSLTILGKGEDNAATGDLDIRSSLDIEGVGAATTIIQWDPTVADNDRERIFDIFDDDRPNVVRIANVTIQNGAVENVSGTGMEGAGLFNTGTTTLFRVVVTHNRAEMDGGGIMNDGEFGDSAVLTVIDSTIAQNMAGAFNALTDGGGGIYNKGGGTLTLERSTVSDNSAPILGGGIFNDGTGGSTITIINSTISGNHSGSNGGGIFNTNSGTVNLQSVTVANNEAGVAGSSVGIGGGVRNNSGTVNFRNTILGDNIDHPSSPGTDAPDCSGTLVSQGYNLVENTAGCTFTINNDKTGIDPQLGPLADNGGPTQTQALLPGSPAIDMANPAPPGSGGDACEKIDQRYVHRPQGPICDIGAFEFVVAAPSPTLSMSVLMLTAILLAVGGNVLLRRRAA